MDSEICGQHIHERTEDGRDRWMVVVSTGVGVQLRSLSPYTGRSCSLPASWTTLFLQRQLSHHTAYTLVAASTNMSAASASASSGKIAVVGMAVQYAGAKNKDEFWKTLNARTLNTKSITAKRLGTKDKEFHIAKDRSKFADQFNNDRYGTLDDDSIHQEHDLLLRLARDALDDYGRPTTKETKERCGIVSGCLSFPHDTLQKDLHRNVYQPHFEAHMGDVLEGEEVADAGQQVAPAAMDPASYVANQLGLGGTHYCLDAACASALYVLKTATDHLLSGRVDMMLAGASTFPEPFFILTGFSTFQALPLAGDKSVPLDTGSKGLTPGEGGAIMVLKRFEDAVRDGDHIYGSLLGVGVSNAGTGLPLKPHQPSQVSCLKETYERIGILPRSVQYVECHATGTVQGDKAEVEAMKECFGPDNCPRYGSTKGNFGHTLVAAGFAGMCKVLLSFQHNSIPGTPGVENAVDANLVQENIPWPNTLGGLKRAGLSAFGFGGTNAHAVFEEYKADVGGGPVVIKTTDRSPKKTFPSPMYLAEELAIVGMEARFGTLGNLSDFERAIFEGKDASRDLPEKRWRFLTNDDAFLKRLGLSKKPRGCFIDKIDVDYSRIRTPMTKEDELIPQQLLALSVMDAALLDAQLPRGGKVAVLVGLGTELELYRHRERLAIKEQLKRGLPADQTTAATDYINNAGTSTSYVSFIGNLISTRLSAMWGFTGPSFTITEGENSTMRCLEVARELLSSGQVDAAVVAGVDLCGSAESFYLKSKEAPLSTADAPIAPFEHRYDGTFIGEGAGAIVLKRAKDVLQETRVYATVKGVGTGTNTASSSRVALGEAGVNASAVEYLEVSSSLTGLQAVPIRDLGAVYKSADSKERNISVGSVHANIGHVGYASGIAALIKTSLCLYNRYLPETPRWEKPKDDQTWKNSSFYVCPDSRAWMKNPGERRFAAVNSVSSSGSHFHVVLSDAEGHFQRNNLVSVGSAAPKLLKVVGNSPQDVLTKLKQAVQMVDRLQNMEEQEVFFANMLSKTLAHGHRDGEFVLSIVASAAGIAEELRLALKGLGRTVKLEKDWASPSGSFFTCTPLRSNKIAFMYGDGASPYCGLGREMYRMCPGMHEVVHEKTTSMWSTSDEAWNTREVLQSQMKHAEEKFVHRTVDKFRSGVFHSTMFTAIAKDVLGIEPRAAFGLSMGEVAILFAFSNANSKQSAEMTRRLNSSPVWTKELAVEFNALRNAWDIPQNAPVESFWRGYLVHASRNVVEKAVSGNKYVRLVIVNDSRTVIIAGKPEECLRVCKKIGAHANEIPQGMVGHCDFVKPHSGAIQYVHDMLEVPKSTGSTKLYTGVGCTEMPKVKGKALGDHVANIYTEIADFERLVNKVYGDGHDVFIELGADSHRSNAVKNILRGKKHVAVSIDRRGERLYSQVLKMCAVLISHGVAVDVSKLYHPDDMKERVPRKRLQRYIEINGRFGNIRPPSPVKKKRPTEQRVSSKKKIPCPHGGDYGKEYNGPLVFDYKDLLEFAEGDIAKVFGPEYSIIDTYPRRVRLPMEEYLLCTRVTHVRDVELGRFNKCSMVTEYDIPINGPHSDGGDVPWAILVESGQCDLMLISMLGVDLQCKGKRVYRLLNTTLTFYGVAHEGDTLVYDIKIDDYAKKDGEISMFFFQYDCFVNGKLLIEMRGGCAGFFSDEDLAAGKGVLYTKAVLAARSKIKKKSIKPFLIEPATKTEYSQADMIGLVNREWARVVGPTALGLEYKLTARKMLMIDEVTNIIPGGGAHGLGLVIGKKYLERDHWYFPCHFKGDQVMAGSLVSDGCSQLLKLYMVWLGLHKTVSTVEFRPVNGQPNKVRCRGQISPHKGNLIYVMEIREIGFDPKTGFPFCIADVDIIDIDFEKGHEFRFEELDTYGRGDMNKKIVVDFKGIALQIEGDATPINPTYAGQDIPSRVARAITTTKPAFSRDIGRRAPARRDPPAGCLITDRNPPNGLTWHPLAGVNGNPTPFFSPTKYPPRAITFVPFPNNPNDSNHEPGVLPLSWYNMCEFMCGRVSACLGQEFKRFDNSTTSRSPAFDLQVVTRVISVTNLEKGKFYNVDVNPSKGTMVAQFDVPEDAWFFKANSRDGLMPYSILMEIGLQTSGILTSWVKAPLTMDKDDILFRNLDATAELVKYIDLRGKTITNTSHVVGYSMLGNMGVHRFTFELSVDGDVFYKGETSFGWFVPEVFEKQVGLDNGKKVQPWHISQRLARADGIVKYDMTSDTDRRRLFAKAEGEKLLRRSKQVEFLDTITLLPMSGVYKKGYVHGQKIVDKNDWFFSCHFWCDPVMPGSLGVESMYQMMEAFCIHSGVGGDMTQRCFEHDLGKVSWKYRGQLTPKNNKMDAEVHIKSVTHRAGQYVVIADGFLLVDNLRVYSTKNMRLIVQESEEQIAAVAKPVPRARPLQQARSTTLLPRKEQFSSQVGRRAPARRDPPAGCLITDRNPPNGLTWHPLAGVNGNPTPFFSPTKYPPRAITFVPFPNNPNDSNHEPGVLPLSWYNMCEFMCGRVSACLGQEFKRFDNSTTSRSPAFDLQVVTRVISVTNLEKGKFYNVDVNPSKGTMVAQFDVPEDAWFFKANSRDGLMPYSILMEIGLQTSGILTSWVKAPLTMDKDDILFRNLDATAELVKYIDLRGKTITNTSHVVGYSMLGNMGVHRFTFELSVDGDVFYKGETSFGWFVPEVFEKQVGLDNGKKVQPWHISQRLARADGIVKYDMTSDTDRRRLFAKAEGEKLLRRSKQVEFLDTITLLPMSGVYKKGYVHGQKIVDKNDWFFSCHFWCDPVMPGSLGVESMYQMMEAFCIHSGVGGDMTQRCFEHDLGKVSWKYRGQLTPKNNKMDAEVHIKSIKSVSNRYVVIADGFLLVDNLRVYSTKNMRLVVKEVETLNKNDVGTLAPVAAPVAPSTAAAVTVSKKSARTPFVMGPKRLGTEELRRCLLTLDQPVYISNSVSGLNVTLEEPSYDEFRNFAEIHACTPTTMGDPGFMEMYGVDYPLYTGAMAKGIASAELVVALGKRKILASLGAGGMPLDLVNKSLDIIQAALPNGPYAVNLIHSPFDDGLERGNVDLFLRRGVTIAEASAFMTLTIHVVRYRVAGLSMVNGKVVSKNKIIAKCSRTELAEMFMRPAPEKFLKKLLESKEITPEQARLAKLVPMSDDVAVESDSGGHTDNRPIHVILPLIMALRDRIQAELKYETPVRVGVGGGIGCPAAMAAAYQMGAAFVITGSVNQIARQSGSSDLVRKELAKAAYSDVTMAPAADMFDQGVKLQVLKKGTMFASRGNKLWELFCKYNSFDEMPPAELARLEKKTLNTTIDEIWKETTAFYINRLHDEAKVRKAETDPKLKMSMVFRWYLSKSSGWANRGEKKRKLDFQIWCGPAMGAYNDFVRGTYLDPATSGVYPDAVQINLQLLTGCSYLQRIQQIRNHPMCRTLNVDSIAAYRPEMEL